MQKFPRRFTLVAFFIAVLCAPALAENSDAARFDGDWDVGLSCPKTEDGRAQAYSYHFQAHVKDGVLHGERDEAGQPGWLRLDGPVKPDGSAALIAEGLTNSPAYAINNVKKGTHFKHAVTAQFDKARGTGSWITIRTCDFTFERQ